MAQKVKNLPAMQETWVWSPGSRKSPGEVNGYPLQYSCLGNPMDRGVWWATVYGTAEFDKNRETNTFTFKEKGDINMCFQISICNQKSFTSFCKFAFMIYPFLTGIKQDDGVSFMEDIISQGLHCTIRCLHAKLETQPSLGRHSPMKGKLRFQLPWATSTKDPVHDTTRAIIKNGPEDHYIVWYPAKSQSKRQNRTFKI